MSPMSPCDVLFAVGISLVVAIPVCTIAIWLMRSMRRSPASRRAVIVGGLSTLVWIGLVACLLLLNVFGLLWWLAAIATALMAYGKHAVARQNAFLGLMAVSAERSIPLAAAIKAFSEERGGRFARRARRLVGLLEGGIPLPTALSTVRGMVTPESLPLIAMGHETGALAPALRQAVATRNLHDPIWQSVVPKLVYVCLVPWFATIIVAFIMLKIVPQFEKIFKDFGTKLPDATLTLISCAKWCGNYWFLVVWPLLLLTAVLAGYAALRYAGVIRWDLPGTGWMVRRLDAAAVLDALSLATGHQQPLAPAIFALANFYPKRPIRRRLLEVLGDFDAGDDWCESLRRHRLIGQADLAVLQAAARVGNLSWAMREMADSNRRRFTYRAHALVQVLFPPIVLAYGLAVMFIVVALFLPLIQLIRSLA